LPQFPQPMCLRLFIRWVWTHNLFGGKRKKLNYQHTFVSGTSIQLAFLNFNGTGTLHDPMAMSCFMFLCCLEQIGYYARDTWNLSIQLLKLKTIAKYK
jgi:hypothetical protein